MKICPSCGHQDTTPRTHTTVQGEARRWRVAAFQQIVARGLDPADYYHGIGHTRFPWETDSTQAEADREAAMRGNVPTDAETIAAWIDKIGDETNVSGLSKLSDAIRNGDWRGNEGSRSDPGVGDSHD